MKRAAHPVLVSVNDLQPAVYNPREADGFRLDLLEMSLRHLGFVLPLYSTPDGHLLSGHQRLTVAKRIGCTKVPVVYVDIKQKDWKNVNLLFNRITNDMDCEDNSEVGVNALEGMSLDEALDGIVQKTPDTDAFYPCMFAEEVPLGALMEKASRKYSSTAIPHPSVMLSHGIEMPVLVSKSGKIVNGNYRGYAAVEAFGPEAVYPAVTLDDKEAFFAEMVVNLISMKFTVEKQFANSLRWGGFRRPTNKVDDLVASMRYWADGKRVKGIQDSLENPQGFWNAFRSIHGETVCDLGAGQRRNGLILRKKGIDCVDWEPFPCDWQRLTEDPKDVPSITLARMVSNAFLDRIEQGVQFDSVFMNAVINSVPFHKDRMMVLALAHAMSSYGTTVYGSARQITPTMTDRPGMLPLNHIDKDGMVSAGRQTTRFSLGYEEGIYLADIAKAPKVQKFHRKAQLENMLKVFWEKYEVHGRETQPYMFFSASCPKRISPKVVAEAVAFEFDLPYPDGQRIDLRDRALEVFGKRFKVDLASLAPPREDNDDGVKAAA